METNLSGCREFCLVRVNLKRTYCSWIYIWIWKEFVAFYDKTATMMTLVYHWCLWIWRDFVAFFDKTPTMMRLVLPRYIVIMTGGRGVWPRKRSLVCKSLLYLFSHFFKFLWFFVSKKNIEISNFDPTWCRAIDRRNESAFLKFFHFIFFLSRRTT